MRRERKGKETRRSCADKYMVNYDASRMTVVIGIVIMAEFYARRMRAHVQIYYHHFPD